MSDEKFVLQKEIEENPEIISINGGRSLEEIQKEYPNLEIIIGKATPEDKPIRLNLLEMEHDRAQIFDAATETVLGKRVDILEKPVKFPFAFVTFVVGAMVASSFWLYFGKFFY